MSELLKHPDLRTPELRKAGIFTGAELLEREQRNGMPEGLARLWRFLSKHCRGRRNAMKSADIGLRLGYVMHSNGRMLGDGKKIVHLASALVGEHLKPVASVCTGPVEQRGLFVAVTRDEKDAESASLDGRIIALARRKRAFQAAPMKASPPKQGELHFNEK